MAQLQSPSLDIKIVVLGDASVGKTSIINRYCNGLFQEDSLSTIGAGFFTHSISVDNKDVTLMIWDTAGQERFRCVTPSLLRGSSGLVLVYDVLTLQSFEDLDIYMEMFLDSVNVGNANVRPVLLLGNKIDLGESIIPDKMVKEWSAKHKILCSAMVSAKTGDNIEDAFNELVKFVIAPKTFDNSSLQLTYSTDINKKGTCPC